MKKLKFQYQRPVKIDPNDGIRKRYPHMRNAYFKKFSTYPERSFYFFHLIKYKDYPLKLRVARGSGLPEEWDDLPSSVYKIAKSWKHNSKRRNQHYKNSNKIEMIHMQNINETLDGIVKKI